MTSGAVELAGDKIVLELGIDQTSRNPWAFTKALAERAETVHVCIEGDALVDTPRLPHNVTIHYGGERPVKARFKLIVVHSCDDIPYAEAHLMQGGVVVVHGG